MKKYVQLTPDERVLMSHLRWQGLSYSKIAEQLGRHRSAIYREFQRNSCTISMELIAPLKPSDGLERVAADLFGIPISRRPTSSWCAITSDNAGALSK